MAQLLKYTLSDGQVVGCFTSDHQEMLAAQVVIDDPVYGYILTDPEIPAEEQTHHDVVEEAIVAKLPVVLTATPNPFTADGVAECTITADPFVPCWLRVNTEEPVELTYDDPTLALTADVPALFTVTMVPRPGYWADTLIVEAV
jgi:hypothetical protein